MFFLLNWLFISWIFAANFRSLADSIEKCHLTQPLAYNVYSQPSQLTRQTKKWLYYFCSYLHFRKSWWVESNMRFILHPEGGQPPRCVLSFIVFLVACALWAELNDFSNWTTLHQKNISVSHSISFSVDCIIKAHDWLNYFNVVKFTF